MIIGLSFATTVVSVNAKDLIKTRELTKTIILSDKKAQNDVLQHEEFKRLREEIKLTNKILNEDSTSVIANWLSVVGIVITIFLGWLTYRLTIKYGESTQRVEDLEKLILGIEEQRNLTIENSKPLLKDVSIGINKMPEVNSYEFAIKIKNFGFRPALQVKIEWIFYKLNNTGSIQSHGKQVTKDETQYQNMISPSEDWEYKVIGNLIGGLTDLNTVITRLELQYFDQLKNLKESYYYYYGFQLEKNSKLTIKTLPNIQINVIDTYMDTLS